ncbi:MAG: zf-HC2 domain-containing protein [Acidobacteriota bacterium]|nr:zf-HC2 domain-containing protein [Acidobacteriota bacterium]
MPNLEEEKCEAVQHWLDAYLDGELGEAAAGNIARHLEICADCSESAAAILQAKKLLRRAASNEAVPDALREKIQKQIRAKRHPFKFLFARKLLAAAAVILFVCFGSLGIFIWQRQSPANLARVSRPNQTIAEQITELLRIGLGDHVHCALEEGYAERHYTSEEISGKLGAEYAGLAPLVKEKIDGEFDLVVAHHCTIGGRKFVHLILRKNEKILSLVITKKNGETFSGRDGIAPLQTSSVALYQEAFENYAVASFETETDLVFFVSNLTTAENLRIASNAAPAVRDFLDESNANS